MLYKYINSRGNWSNLVNKEYLKNYFKRNCSDYGSEFEDWFADMVRQDLIRKIYV